jgi:hypothetical protein
MSIQTHLHAARGVAVIGAGPAGLAAGRWLVQHGFEPVIFEAAAGIGGQWNGASPACGTWPGMRTNTSRVLTAFSDLPHGPDVALYPTQAQMAAYLGRYARQSGLGPHLRLDTRVAHLRGADDGWLVQAEGAAGTTHERFAQVWIATGRQAAAARPFVPGLAAFAGTLGVHDAARYRGAEAWRGRDVVVAGGSISALEIAADLALAGARSVTVTSRRQRYVLPKLLQGVPTDHVLFTRAAALAAEHEPPAALAAGLKALLQGAGADPARYGAPAAHADPFAAGISQSQFFLPLVAEGRIVARPWMTCVDGRRVEFADGSHVEADGLIMATGYRLSLPFLDESLRATLRLDDEHIELHDHSLHPELPGLAFLGLYDQTGPLLPVLELQARWLTYVLAGLAAAPTPEQMQAGIARHRERRAGPQGVMMNAMALLFARHAGVEPELARWPELRDALLHGPLSPMSFRLQGPDALPDAADRVAGRLALDRVA